MEENPTKGKPLRKRAHKRGRTVYCATGCRERGVFALLVGRGREAGPAGRNQVGGKTECGVEIVDG